MKKAILNFTLFFGIFYFIGYNFGHLTEGTIFDNTAVMLITVFIIIFAVDYVGHFFKKKGTTDQNSGEEDDVNSELEQLQHTWNLKFKGGHIKIVNHYNEEKLFINGTLVDESKRSSWVSWLKVYHTLRGNIEVNGQSYPLEVKLGGVMSLRCKVYVDQQLVYEDQIKYKLLGKKIEKIEKNVEPPFKNM